MTAEKTSVSVSVSEEHWTLDKRIPIALIMTVFAQFGAAVWMVSSISADVSELQRSDTRMNEQIREQRTRIENVDAARNQTDMRLIRVEEQTRQIYEAVRRIDSNLEQQRRGPGSVLK